MKAVLCRAHGAPSTLDIAEVPDLTPGKGEVVIRIKAAALNFPDTLVIQGKYQFQPPMPFSPGSDVAGIITAVGEEVEGLSIGTPVFAFLGMMMGGFAEEARADAQMVTPIPPGIDFSTAAAFQMTYATSYHALKDRAQLCPGETVLVLGAAGGVGMAAVELAKRMGARVIAAASSDEKLAACTQAGADATINYATEDLRERLKAFTNGNGVDVIYDPVGGAYAEPALRSMAWNGRYLVVGFAAGDIPRIPLNLPLLKGCSIVGVFWGGFVMREAAHSSENMHQLATWLATGEIHPLVSRAYPLADAAQALEDMSQRRVTGKVVLVTE